MERTNDAVERQSISFTMRTQKAKWENLKKPNDVLFVSEWRSQEDLRKFGEENGDRFQDVTKDREDMAWGLSDARSFEPPGCA